MREIMLRSFWPILLMASAAIFGQQSNPIQDDAFIKAAQKCDSKAMKRALDAGANVNYYIVAQGVTKKMTAAMWAVGNCRSDAMLRVLLAAKADFNIRLEDDTSVLWLAENNNFSKEMLDSLKAAGAKSIELTTTLKVGVKPAVMVRDAPSLKGKILAQLSYGTEVKRIERNGVKANLLGYSGEWVPIRSGELKGWVYGPLLVSPDEKTYFLIKSNKAVLYCPSGKPFPKPPADGAHIMAGTECDFD